MAVASLGFGLIHGNAAAFLPLSALGGFLAWLYLRTGNLWAPILAHFLFNLVPFVLDCGRGELRPLKRSLFERGPGLGVRGSRAQRDRQEAGSHAGIGGVEPGSARPGSQKGIPSYEAARRPFRKAGRSSVSLDSRWQGNADPGEHAVSEFHRWMFMSEDGERCVARQGEFAFEGS